MSTEDFFTLKTGTRQGELAQSICSGYVACSRACMTQSKATGNWVLLSVGSWAGEPESVGLRWGSRESKPKWIPHSEELLPRFGSLAEFQLLMGRDSIEALAYEFLWFVDEGKVPLPA